MCGGCAGSWAPPLLSPLLAPTIRLAPSHITLHCTAGGGDDQGAARDAHPARGAGARPAAAAARSCTLLRAAARAAAAAAAAAAALPPPETTRRALDPTLDPKPNSSSLQEDGGDIVFRTFDPDTGVVTLKMMGACRWAGGPSPGRQCRLSCSLHVWVLPSGDREGGPRCAAPLGLPAGRCLVAHAAPAAPPPPPRRSGCPSSAVTLKSGIENMLQHYIPEVRFAWLYCSS